MQLTDGITIKKDGRGQDAFTVKRGYVIGETVRTFAGYNECTVVFMSPNYSVLRNDEDGKEFMVWHK